MKHVRQSIFFEELLYRLKKNVEASKFNVILTVVIHEFKEVSNINPIICAFLQIILGIDALSVILYEFLLINDKSI